MPVAKTDRRHRGLRPGQKNRFRFERPKELFNLRWDYSSPGADEVDLLCDTTLPGGTVLTFKVLQLEKRVGRPLPSSYMYDARPDGEYIGSTLQGTVQEGTARATWPFPTDDEGNTISPYNPSHWYRERDDLNFGDADELPENLDELLMQDDLRPFVFIVEYQDEWAMSPSPASGKIDIELDFRGEGEPGSVAKVLGSDGEMEVVAALEGKLSKEAMADGPILVHIPNVYFGSHSSQ